MRDDKNWNDIRFWAAELDEKYPRTDLIALSNTELIQMLLSLDEAKNMPALQRDDAYFFALKSEWAIVQNGGVDDSGDVPDAYI
ncbi:MAG: Fe-S cluster assembly protein IscX [Alphaproteobacteria bacterium]|nr:Fe-S cluster assembly protein IscX [Alphaproteobacteria bacterium]